MHVQIRYVEKPNKKREIMSSLMLFLCFAYVASFFIHSQVLQTCLAFLAMVVFFTSLPAVKAAPRLFGTMMFVTGLFLHIGKGSGAEEMISGSTANLPLLTLVTLVPLAAIPLKIGGYLESINFYLEKFIHDSKKMFGGITLFVFCLGPILNMGSIKVLHEMLQDVKLPPALLAKAYLIGFSTVMLWSPYFASVATVLYYLNVPVFDYLPIGLSLAVIQFLIGNLLFWRWEQKHGTIVKPPAAMLQRAGDKVQHRKRMRQLFMILAILLAALFTLEHLTRWPMITLVILIVLAFPVIWVAVNRQWTPFKQHLMEFKRHSVPMMNNEIVLMISAGLFSKSLIGTAAADGIQVFLLDISAQSFLLFVLTVMCVFVTLTFAGIQPLVLATILATTMDPVLLGTSKEVLALLLMICWSISAVLSPTNPVNIMVGNLVEKPGTVVGVKWSGIYLLTMFCIGACFLYVIH